MKKYFIIVESDKMTNVSSIFNVYSFKWMAKLALKCLRWSSKKYYDDMFIYKLKER